MRQLILSLVVIATACTPGLGPLNVTVVQQSKSNCEIPEEGEPSVAGYEFIDVAADPKVLLVATISGGELFTAGAAQPPLVVSGRTIAPDGRDSITIQRVNLRYTAKPPIPGLGASVVDAVPVTGLISRTTPNLRLQFPLFGPIARKQFRALGASNTDPPIQFTASFEFQGLTTSGAEVRTPPVAIPMNIIKSEITCASADPRIRRFESSTATELNACLSAGIGLRLGNNPALCCDALDPMTQTPRVTPTPGCDILP